MSANSENSVYSDFIGQISRTLTLLRFFFLALSDHVHGALSAVNAVAGPCGAFIQSTIDLYIQYI